MTPSIQPSHSSCGDLLSLQLCNAEEQEQGELPHGRRRIPLLPHRYEGNTRFLERLFAGGIHPKRKVQTLSAAERKRLFRAIRRVLADMAKRGGRDTEKDLFGELGRYQTKLSRLTVGSPCAKCDTPILKQNYLGGSVYVCETCQPLTK